MALRFDAFLNELEHITTGSLVHKGEPMMRVYSSALSAAAAQYVTDLGLRDTGGLPQKRGARQRLENLGVPDEIIAEIEKSRQGSLTVTWPAPRDGFVVEHNVVEGMQAKAGDILFRIADLSVVWVLADVAERDLGLIAPGQTVTVTPRGYPGRTFTGKIGLIYPVLNKETRTARVRIELANPDGILKPNMYADAVIESGSGAPVIAVPESAVINSGTRQAVILDKGEGRFEPRPVLTGHARQRLCRDQGGRFRGREGCHRRQLPHRRRKQPQGGTAKPHRGRRPMIARIIDWSARNIMIVLIATFMAAAGGIYALKHLPLDAIPDLSDTQVIVYTTYPGQAPQVVEDQVTYPLAAAMLTVPKSKVVRAFSFFGVSFVYIIFEDGTDIYWARSRVLEYLNAAASRLPTGVAPVLGPDATSVGWVYQYAVISKDLNLAQTRSLQDWTLRYGLAKAEGVAEVASAGGFVKQYNVVVDPQKLRDLGIPLDRIREVIRASNTDVGGRTLELSEFEFVVRGKGYLRGLDDLGKIAVKADNGTPVQLRDVARLELGPEERRGITELNGEGEVASGIALQRFGLNALDVIDNVKKRIAELAASLPKGTDIVPVYDRSNLIHAAIGTLKPYACRGMRNRRDCLHRLPAAYPQRPRRHPHAAGGHPDGVRGHALAGPRRQHHEPGRHRDCHRRHDRRRDCDDRERAQASGAAIRASRARRS